MEIITLQGDAKAELTMKLTTMIDLRECNEFNYKFKKP